MTLEEKVEFCSPDPFSSFIPGAAARRTLNSCSIPFTLDFPPCGKAYSQPAWPKAGCKNIFPGFSIWKAVVATSSDNGSLVVKVIFGFPSDLFCFLSHLVQTLARKHQHKAQRSQSSWHKVSVQFTVVTIIVLSCSKLPITLASKLISQPRSLNYSARILSRIAGERSFI